MRYHLDPVGGVAGDMFAAAMLDCHPPWQSDLSQAVAGSGLHAELGVRVIPHSDSVLTGKRFSVQEPHDSTEYHRPWREIRAAVETSVLPEPVRARAIAIFGILAEVEAKVHGKPVADVSFHELGEWDSIADIVTAAWLIDRCGAAEWTSAPLPIGRGRVQSAHGRLPVPAPAVSALLHGFPVIDDGVLGERITPTGAAILRHLAPSFAPVTAPMRLVGEGYGFGTKTFEGFSNVLRVLRFETRPGEPGADRVAQCEFEVDDQSPEDLAVGLQNLREQNGVLDVIQSTVYAKKGRLAMHVRVLAQLQHLDAIIDTCLTETTTLGVRWHFVDRRILTRSVQSTEISGNVVRVKRVHRPGAVVTGKAEMTDLADAPHGHAGRQERRRQAESGVDATANSATKEAKLDV